MERKIIRVLTLVVLLAMPIFGLAVTTVPLPNVNTSLNITTLIDLIFNFIWPIIGIIYVIIFLGIGFLFIIANGDPSKVSQARLALLGGVAVVALGLLAFSIPFIIKNSLGV